MDSCFVLKPADLILVHGGGPIQSLIEQVTRSPYSHVAGIVKPNELVEAQGGRLTGYQALDYYDGVADVFTCELMTDEQRQTAVSYVLTHCGTRYAYGLIGWEAVHFLLGVDLPMQDSQERFDCSQLWYDAYKAAGIDLCPGMRFVAPSDLARSKLLKKVRPI